MALPFKVLKLMLSLTFHTTVRGNFTGGAHNFGELLRQFQSALVAARTTSMTMLGLAEARLTAILRHMTNTTRKHPLLGEFATREAFDAIPFVLFPMVLAAGIAAIIHPSTDTHPLDGFVNPHAVVAHSNIGPCFDGTAVQLGQFSCRSEIVCDIDGLGMVIPEGASQNGQGLLQKRDGQVDLFDAPISRGEVEDGSSVIWMTITQYAAIKPNSLSTVHKGLRPTIELCQTECQVV